MWKTTMAATSSDNDLLSCRVVINHPYLMAYAIHFCQNSGWFTTALLTLHLVWGFSKSWGYPCSSSTLDWDVPIPNNSAIGESPWPWKPTFGGFLNWRQPSGKLPIYFVDDEQG